METTPITFHQILHDESIRTYIKRADKTLERMGYTEHSFAHVGRVSRFAGDLLEALDCTSAHTVELARIAGYMHDIGNVINRIDHAQSGAMMAFRLLDKMGMPCEDIAKIVAAIGNHDESTAFPVSKVSAALIIADKSDVRRSRVRNNKIETFDIHDRVNYAVTDSQLHLSDDKTEVVLSLTLDTSICSVLDYFEIFLNRMKLCQRAAAYLHLRFRLFINHTEIC